MDAYTRALPRGGPELDDRSALGNGLMWPSFLALLSKATGERHQGAVQGLAGACGSLASVVGLVAGGVLYDMVGAATFAVSAGTIFAVAALALRLDERRRRPTCRRG